MDGWMHCWIDRLITFINFRVLIPDIERAYPIEYRPTLTTLDQFLYLKKYKN